MSITVSYQKIQKTVNVMRFPSKTREYIEVSLKNYVLPEIGDNVVINVNCSSDRKFRINYVVIGRTGIFSSHKEYQYMHEFEINFEALVWMLPEVQVLVYYIEPTGEVIYDSVAVKFEGNPNEFSVSLSANSSKPQGEIDFLLKSKPDSTVYMLAVDHSVNLRRKANDITEKAVLDSFKPYKNFEKLQYSGSFSDDDKYVDVGESNSFIITNAYDGYVSCFNLLKTDRNFPNDDDEFGLEESKDVDEFESKVRNQIPETWFFNHVKVNKKGMEKFSEKLPNIITSWDVTAFSISKDHGLGIAKAQKLTVSQEFFAMMHLPYSIRIDEVLRVDVTVFNYFSKLKNIKVDVILYSAIEGQDDEENSINVEDIEFVEREFEFYESRKEQGQCRYSLLESESREGTMKKTIDVPQGSGSSTFFYVKATKAGIKKVKLRAKVRGRKLFDEIHKTLLVEYDAIRYEENLSHLIDLRDKDSDNIHKEIQIPEGAINSSIKVERKVFGDLIGPALINTENLIQIPSGCYEQRLKGFIPNIVALDYLNATKKLTKEKLALGQRALVTGVQQMLETKIDSGTKKGAFSIWNRKGSGDSDSVWLTAYIAKSLGKAKHLIAIQDKHIFEALTFLSSQQQSNGSFPEYGQISYYNLQTDSSMGIALTAYVTIAFLENKDYKQSLEEVVEKALNYIDEHISTIEDNYALSIAAYALALGGREVNGTLSTLNEKAYRKEQKFMFWEKSSDSERSTSQATKNEIAAYAILAHVKHGLSKEAIPIVNWLVAQRNPHGGFSSTHDTVICIQALAEIATELYTDELDMTIKFDGDDLPIKITKNNAEPQRKEMPPTYTSVSMQASGKGIASFQVSYSYYMKTEDVNKVFNLNHTELPNDDNKNLLRLKVCASLKDEDPNIERTGMAVIEVQLPSGYIADTSFDLLDHSFVKKYELKDGDTLVVIYFDSIDRVGVCPEVHAIAQKFVDELKQVPIKVWDYYQTENRNTIYYLPSNVQSC